MDRASWCWCRILKAHLRRQQFVRISKVIVHSNNKKNPRGNTQGQFFYIFKNIFCRNIFRQQGTRSMTFQTKHSKAIRIKIPSSWGSTSQQTYKLSQLYFALIFTELFICWTWIQNSPSAPEQRYFIHYQRRMLCIILRLFRNRLYFSGCSR